jgi:glucose/arabinose dehydrogenase
MEGVMRSIRSGWSAAVSIVLLSIGSYISSQAQQPATLDQNPGILPQIELEPVLTGLSMPVFLTNARDGSNRLFIVEQAGRIKVLQPGSSSPSVFLDIVQRVTCCGEQGLLGLTFHPQFSSNRRFFVDYTRRGDGATVIAEYRVSAGNPNVADQNETVLLTIPQPFANHNGGMIEFGPDGFLYIAMGDGGSGNDPGNRAQNVNELLGKFLRIDVDNPGGGLPYSSPPTNPFFGGTPGRDEIYALGLRNPWRFSFDRATGRLFVGDVGQNVIEEVDIIEPGGNYGWRVFEGTRCTNVDAQLCNPSNFVQPITEYSHSGGRCSITGGYVYRGPLRSLPSGSYVFGDFCSGEIFLFNGGQQSLLMDTNLNISSFGEDEDGELYVVGLGGTVQRIADPVEIPPISPRIDSAIVRKRSNGKILDPLSVRSNAKKFEVVVRGGGFVEGMVLVANGRELKTESGEDSGVELIARFRQGTLAAPGPLTIEAVVPGGARSNAIILQIVGGQ